ncbi:MAG: putative Ig domain-containing protein, partial [Terrabacter sp.]
ITVTDPGTLSDTASLVWQVDNTNRAPSVTSPGDQSNTEGETVNVAVSATDPDGDTLTYAATGLPDGVGIDTGTGTITGTVGYTAAGTHAVTITVTDPGTLSDTVSFVWQVDNTNRAPSVTSPGDQSDTEGEAVNVTVQASDPDGDALTYAATGLPTGLSIDPGTGTITGTVGYTAAGTHAVTITVTDPGTLSDTASFVWQVDNTNRAPSVTSPGNQSGTEGETVNVTVQASDPDGDALTYAATGLPDGVGIDTGTGTITGTLAAGSAGTHPVTVTVNDGTTTAQTTFTWTVTAPDVAPAPPSGLITRVTSTTAIDVDWAANVEPDVDHYTVYRRAGQTGTFALLATVNAGSAYHDTTAPDGTLQYQVTASDVGGNESGPATVTVSPRVVLHGTATAARQSTKKLSLSRPASARLGDLLVVVVSGDVSTTVTPPVGWATVRAEVATGPRQWVYSHTYGKKEPNNYSWTIGGSGPVSAALMAYGGVSAVGAVLSAASTGTTAVAPSVPVTDPGSAVLALYSVASGTSVTPGPEERATVTALARQSAVTTVVADAIKPEAGDSGTAPAALGASSAWRATVIVLRPTR